MLSVESIQTLFLFLKLLEIKGDIKQGVLARSDVAIYSVMKKRANLEFQIKNIKQCN